MTDLEFIIEQNDQKPTEPPPALISEYVHGLRVIPAGEPKSGVLDVYYMPHLIEPMDCMGPYSGVNITSIMKSVQAGVTFNCAENVTAYYMGANPKQQLYVTATLSLLEKWTSTRLDPMMISCDLKKLLTLSIDSVDISKKSRRSPDKMYSKQYPGGALSMTSLESPAGLRSESKQIVIIDEIDATKAKLSTGEGSSVEVVHGRAAAFGSRGKFMEFSTPTTFERSIIYKRYLMGDQRKYMVPCPIDGCGVFQVLEFEKLQPDFDNNGLLKSVWYQCPECDGRINNWDKTEMLRLGYWEPTEIPSSKGHRSYHINTLYNPVGMMDWKAVYQKFLTAQENPAEFMPPFVNNYLGLPYKEEGSRPDYKKVIALRGAYKSKTIPEGILYLTLSADIQRGKEKYQNMTPAELSAEMDRMAQQGKDPWLQGLPRIELEVMGVGHNHCSWSIEYKVIYGHTTLGAYAGAFENFYKWAEETELTYKRGDGVEFAPKIIFFDASDGTTQPTVYDFADRFGYNTFPIVNDGWLKKKKDPGVDEQSRLNFDRYRISSSAKYNKKHIDVSTNHYKGQVYTRINRTLKADKPGIPTYCDFPMDYPDYYFKMLTAEEQRENGSFHDGGRRNEALDIRGYNLCAADVWLDGQVREAQEWAKKKGYSKYDIEQHDKKFILNRLDAKINKGA